MKVVTTIDIGSDSLKWVKVDLGGDRPVVKGWNKIRLPGATLTGNFNKLGLRKPAALDEALEKAVDEASLRRTEAAVTFPDQYVKVFFTELDRLQDLTEAERRYTLWRIRQQLPASIISECILDYQHVRTLRRDRGPVFKLLVEAVREEILNELASRVSRRQVWPSYLNANCFCTYNLFSERLEAEVPGETPFCLLHIGHYSTTFSFFRNGVIEYIRILDYAWRNFIDTLVEIEDCGEDEARKKLAGSHYLPSTSTPSSTGLKNIDVFQRLFEEWFREMESTFAFHKNKHPYLGRPLVFLCGGGAVLGNLPSFLERLLDTSVQVLDPADVVEFQSPREASREQRLGLSAAIGAALSAATGDAAAEGRVDSLPATQPPPAASAAGADEAAEEEEADR